MSELTRFQDAFAEALAGDFAPLAAWTRGDAAETRFSVYRNTVAKGCADAVAAQFPAVLRVVGEDWLRQAAVIFAREHPPARPSLHAYGEAFPDWLSAFPPAADMPWLACLARIDWAWTVACFAADAEALGPAAFASLSSEALERQVAGLHPAARLLWFEDGTPSLWVALQAEDPPAEAALASEPEGLLLTRPGLEVGHLLLSRGAYAFLQACRIGESLAMAAQAALAAEPDLPLAETFAELIIAGAFARLTPLSETRP